MANLYLGLGSNLGDRHRLLEQARTAISRRLGPVAAASGLYRTGAWGRTDQPDFLNQVVLVHTGRPPRQCLQIAQQIEAELGRERQQHWGSRTIDIDLLYYDGQVIDEPDLRIPHPLLQERRFVLQPLAEVAPDFVHPELGQSNRQLLEQCPDPLTVEKTDIMNAPETKTSGRMRWLKRFGIAGFLFFFLKGLVWLAIIFGIGKCAF